MKYKIDTKELYTDNGVFVKKMQCSMDVIWENMQTGKSDIEKICSHCNKTVLDVQYLSDEEVLFVMDKKPDTCLKINAKKY